MWIRSQDKEKLIKVNNFYISNFEDHTYIETIYNEETMFILGKYSTEEKATKVLDEIQNRICVIEQWHVIKDLIMRSPQNRCDIDTSGYVYQMPADDEV